MRLSLHHLLAAAVLLALLLPSPAQARSSYLDAFIKRYPTSTLGALNSMHCTLCHPGNNTSKFTLFGAAFKGKSGTPDARLAAIEGLDSDADTYSNLTEIKASTDPSDPAKHTLSATDLFEIQFMERLIDQHNTGVQYSAWAQTKATHAELKTFCVNFTSREQAEISLLKGYLVKWFAITYTPQLYPGTAQSLTDFKAQLAPEFDRQTLELLLVYEYSETYLATQALRRAAHKDLKNLATDIKTIDAPEIIKLLGWVKIW